jgi:membrane protein required for colicin V production
MSHEFTFVDLLTIVLVGLSMVLAIWRGFIWETLSIFSWAAAVIASVYLGSSAAHYLAHMISPLWLAHIAGYALVFFVVLIPISFASRRLSRGVKDSPIGILDRLLGGVFGLVRGLALVGALYLVFTAFIPVSHQPKPLHDARLLPLIQSSAQVLTSLAPMEWEGVGGWLHQHEDAASPVQNAWDVSRVPATRTAGHQHGEKPYGVADRRALDRLIEATGSGGSVKP